MRTGSFQAGSFKLRYKDSEGMGPVCLVVGSTLFYSRAFSQEMNQELRMIYLDHRGFATPSTSVSVIDYSLQVLLEDIERFRREMDLGRIIILGHSAHGYIALEYAKKYPEFVTHICLVATGPSHGVHMQEAERNWLETASPDRKRQYDLDIRAMEKGISRTPENRFVLFCQGMRAKSFYNWNYNVAPLWQEVQTYLPAIDYLFGEVFRDIKVEEGLSDLHQPVLLALGKFDYQVAPPWTWNPYRPHFRNLTVRFFEKSGHNPQLEEAELFYKEVSSWLSNTKKEI